MNLFETVKASVSVPEAARAYGLTVTRHSMARCPFHDDRHPSLKFNPDFYYCFGCGAKGDVIDLVVGLFVLSLQSTLGEDLFLLVSEHKNFGSDPDRVPNDFSIFLIHVDILACNIYNNKQESQLV